jgi:hypothetical protein
MMAPGIAILRAEDAGKSGLFVGDHLADIGDVLLDSGDLFGPGASGVIRVGDSGGVFALGFSEAGEEMVEFLLEGWAGHVRRVPLLMTNSHY